MELSPFRSPFAGAQQDLKEELIRLENRMSQMLTGRSLPDFFKTPDEINADFNTKTPPVPSEFIYYSDTLDGCVNIQQISLGGYMEENY